VLFYLPTSPSLPHIALSLKILPLRYVFAHHAVELVSSDEEDLEAQRRAIFPRTLKAMGFVDGTRLRVFDDLQHYNFEIVVRHRF
jgi:hypothetical protein